MKPTLTYDLAMAAGKDAANAQMKKAGRTAWNLDDYKLCCEMFNRLFPVQGTYRAGRKGGTDEPGGSRRT